MNKHTKRICWNLKKDKKNKNKNAIAIISKRRKMWKNSRLVGCPHCYLKTSQKIYPTI